MDCIEIGGTHLEFSEVDCLTCCNTNVEIIYENECTLLYHIFKYIFRQYQHYMFVNAQNMESSPV